MRHEQMRPEMVLTGRVSKMPENTNASGTWGTISNLGVNTSGTMGNTSDTKGNKIGTIERRYKVYGSEI